MRVPWRPTSLGLKSSRIVEAVSIYQTIAELVGKPVSHAEGLQGASFASTFDGNEGSPSFAFSQFAKSNVTAHELPGRPSVPWGECTKCYHHDIDVMGLSVREERWRYTEWYHWNKSSLAPAFDRPLVGVELYNHAGDLGADFDASAPTVNLGGEAEHAQVRRELSKVLRQHFGADGDAWALHGRIVTSTTVAKELVRLYAAQAVPHNAKAKL